MRDVSNQIVYCKREDGFIKYYNYKEEVLLQIGETLAEELQKFYQVKYDVRDFVLQTMLGKVKEYTKDVGVLDIVETSILHLDKKQSDRHLEE